jgi:hypothetical protein
MVQTFLDRPMVYVSPVRCYRYHRDRHTPVAILSVFEHVRLMARQINARNSMER